MSNAKKIWVRSVKAKIAGLPAYSIGEYINGKWRNINRVTSATWPDMQRQVEAWSDSVGRSVELVAYRGEKLPDWLRF